MICQRCGKKEANWRCRTCGRIVCTDCAKSEGEKIYCIDHAPNTIKEKKPTEKEGKGARNLKTLFYTLLTLTIGLFVISYIGKRFIASVDLPGVDIALEALKSSGMIIIYGMGALTLLVGLGYLIARRI